MSDRLFGSSAWREDDAEPVADSLDEVRANIRAELAEYAVPPIIKAGAIRDLADAYVRLGGDLELAPPAAPVPLADAGRLVEHATRFVCELPGLRDATSWADQLHDELVEISRGAR